MAWPDYDFSGAAISDLGVIAETALVFNSSLVAVGLCNLCGGFYFYRTHGKRWLFAIFALAGIGAVGAGVFRSIPADSTRCSRSSRSYSSTYRPSGLQLDSRG